MSTKARFDQALADIREAGYYAELNTTACCRSCAAEEATADGVVTFARNGRWTADGALTALGYDDRYNVECLWFRFGTIDAARACRKAFRKHGFTVTWNGRQNKCVQVNL